jgi:hypothetical protein
VSDKNTSKQQVDASTTTAMKGNSVATVQPIEDLSKPLLMAEGAKSSHQATTCKEGSGKVLYCFHCKTKGHAIEECRASMYYNICENRDHIQGCQRSYCAMWFCGGRSRVFSIYLMSL